MNSVRLGHERVCFSNVSRLVKMILRSQGALSRSPPVKSLNGEMKGFCWCKWKMSSISWFSRSFHSVPKIIPSNQILYKVNIEPYRPITNFRIYMSEPSPDVRVTNRRRFRWLNGKVFDGISGKCQRYHGVLGHIPLCRQHQSIESNMVQINIQPY